MSSLTSISLSICLATCLATSLLPSMSNAKLIDLTHTLKSSTYVHGGMPFYNRTALAYGEIMPGIFVDHGGMILAEHSGTHIDAPSHFIKDGITLDELSLEDCIADGVMIDCTEEAQNDNEYLVTVEKLQEWEKEHGRIPDNAAVVFNFDWSKKFVTPNEYAGSSDMTNLLTFKFPALTPEAGMWLRDERDIKIIATDTLTPDPLSLTGKTVDDFPIHITYLKEKRLIVENVRDPGRLPAKGFRLYTVPYKFQGASGAPTRTFAITHDKFANTAPILSGSFLAVLVSLWTLFLMY